jgi:hypothetical protein
VQACAVTGRTMADATVAVAINVSFAVVVLMSISFLRLGVGVVWAVDPR